MPTAPIESPGSPSLRAVRTRLAQATAPRSRGHARGKGSRDNVKGSGGYSTNRSALAPSNNGSSNPVGQNVSVSSIFRRVELIGRGAYGAVYKGKHIPTGTAVALKVVNLDTPEDDAQDIQQEVALLSQLKDATAHNVIKYWGCWMRGPEVWIVMDLAEGGSIRTLMKPGSIPERLSALIVRESLVALAWLHRQGVIHRDIKAANLLLTNSGKIMLCDFGVAANLAWSGSNYRPGGANDGMDHKDHKYQRGNYANALGALARAADKAGHKEVQFHNQKEPVRDTSAQDAGWKRTTMIGTPYWMAPEVIMRGALYDQSADVWSLGITIWEMLLGNPPLATVDQTRVIQLIPKNTPPRLGVDSGFSKECRELVQACLNEVPRERPTAEELSKYKWIKSTAKVPTTALTELLTRYNNWVKQGGLRTSLIGGLATNGAEIERKPSKASTTSHSRDSFVYDGGDDDFGWEFSSNNSSPGSGSDSDGEFRAVSEPIDVEEMDLDPSRTPRTTRATPGSGNSTMLNLPPPPPRANSLMHLFAEESDPNTAGRPLLPPPPLGMLAGGSSITLPEWGTDGHSPSNSIGGTLRPPPPIGAGVEARSAPTTPILGGVSTPPLPPIESGTAFTPPVRPPPPPITRAQTAPMTADAKSHSAGFSGTGSTPFRFGGGGGAAVPTTPTTPKPPILGTPAPVLMHPRPTTSPESMFLPPTSPRSSEGGFSTPGGTGSTPGATTTKERDAVPAVPGPTPASHKLLAMTNATTTAGAAAVHRRGQSSMSARDHHRGHSASPSMGSPESKFTRPARSASRPSPGATLSRRANSSTLSTVPTTGAADAAPNSSAVDSGGESTTSNPQRRSRTESAPDPPKNLKSFRPPPPLPGGSVHTRGTHGGSDPTSGAGPLRVHSTDSRVAVPLPVATEPVAHPAVVVPPPPLALDLAALTSKDQVSLALGSRVEELSRWLELLAGSVGGLLE